MYCPNCGKEIADNSTFCTFCGARIIQPEGTETPVQKPVLQRPSPGIELCGDGMYRWFYEFSMLKNPAILLTVYKVFGIIFGVLFLILGISSVVTEGVEAVSDDIIPMLLFLAFFTVLILVSYLILAAMYGWKYMVLFEMNDDGVRHIQQPSQFKKAQAIAWLSAISGAATGHPINGIGRGLIVGSKSESYTKFSDVRKIKVLRGLHTIKLAESLNHNQIYAAKEDFDFVLNYITDHIPDQAKK